MPSLPLHPFALGLYNLSAWLKSVEEYVDELLSEGGDELLEIVAESLKETGCDPEELDETVRGLAELLGENEEVVRRKILEKVL